jgi:hypothetical protein
VLKKGLAYILFVFIMIVNISFHEAEAATISLNPTDDAVVWNWYPDGLNNTEYLWITANERLGDPGNYDLGRAYLKFDLSDIPDASQVVHAELRLYAMIYRGGTVNIWHASGDNWTENWGSLTWNNQPAVDGFLAQLGILDTPASLKYIDISQTWDPTVDLIDNFLSIAITMVDESPEEPMDAEFKSKENQDSLYHRPLLTIEYEEITPVPLPATLYLFGSGILSVIGYRRIFKGSIRSLGLIISRGVGRTDG